MTLPASGPLAMTDIQTEFGGTNPIGLNEYYAGGGLVPAGTSGTYGAVPSSGALSIQNFYGTSQFVPIYIEDVFSTYIYAGNSTNRSIVNDINLSGEGGLVWIKDRDFGLNHTLFDTVRGATKLLFSDNTNAQSSASNTLTAFNSNGFNLGTNSGYVNGSGYNYVSWTFRKQPKFFDVVTYTGTGAGNTINHNLGSTPGCIIIKRTSGTGNWATFARTGTTSSKFTYAYFNTASGLNLTAAAGATGVPAENLGYITATTFDVNNLNGSGTVGGADNINDSGATYVAYLFAHDAGGFGLSGTDNVISCGSYTGNGSTSGPVITLGYEPQWLLVKNASATWGWVLVDNMRGLPVGGTSRVLNPNTSDAEGGLNSFNVSATGFSPNSSGVFTNTNGNTYIYIAIRRGPMEVPTLGTSVFSPYTATTPGQAVVTTGFPVDCQWQKNAGAATDMRFVDRLRGVSTTPTSPSAAFPFLVPSDTTAESTGTGTTLNWNNTGFTVGATYESSSNAWAVNFRRAPGFFDEVCFFQENNTNQRVAHNLSVVPELIIVKIRNAGGDWYVYNQTLGRNQYITLNVNLKAFTFSNVWGTSNPTSTDFGTSSSLLNQGYNFVAYLFATCPGVSKVGSYTGTGSTQTINCGFTAGARFVLIKRTDALAGTTNGDWYVWDSARGIVAGNDPYLLINSTAAQVTSTDYVDTYSAGFEITSTAPAAINANGGTFIFLAIA